MDAAFTGAVSHLRNAARDQVIERQGGRSNLRTALILLSIALVFFIGVIVNRSLFN